MLPKKYRIHKVFFKTVKEKRKMHHLPFFTLMIADTSTKNHVFSVIVSRKTAPKATERNKLKRKGYAIIRDALTHTSALFPAYPRAYVFYLKKDAAICTFSELKKSFLEALKKDQHA